MPNIVWSLEIWVWKSMEFWNGKWLLLQYVYFHSLIWGYEYMLRHSFRDNKTLHWASSVPCYLRLCYFWRFLELSRQCCKHFYLIPVVLSQEEVSALLPPVWTSALVDQRCHPMSTSSKSTQQLITALWPECSGESAPWHCGFSPRSGDNGLSTPAWLAVRRVICRMSVSAESSPV